MVCKTWPLKRVFEVLRSIKMQKLRVIVGFIVFAVPITLAFAHSGAIGIVKERIDMFKKNQGNLKAIKSLIGSDD